MDLPTTFQGLIELWPSRNEFGRQLAGDSTMGRVFYRRNRVPERHWVRLIELARVQGLHVDHLYLRRLWEAGRHHGR